MVVAELPFKFSDLCRHSLCIIIIYVYIGNVCSVSSVTTTAGAAAADFVFFTAAGTSSCASAQTAAATNLGSIGARRRCYETCERKNTVTAGLAAATAASSIRGVAR